MIAVTRPALGVAPDAMAMAMLVEAPTCRRAILLRRPRWHAEREVTTEGDSPDWPQALLDELRAVHQAPQRRRAGAGDGFADQTSTDENKSGSFALAGCDFRLSGAPVSFILDLIRLCPVFHIRGSPPCCFIQVAKLRVHFTS